MKRPCESRGGFTLLELLAVIGIIAIMSVIVTGSFTNIGRAIAASNSVDALRRTLMLARQTACVDGVETYVWVTDVNKFVTCRLAGTVTKVPTGSIKSETSDQSISSDKWIVDEYADLSSARESFAMLKDMSSSDWTSMVHNYTGLRVFDLTEGKMAYVTEAPFYSTGQDAWIFAVADRKNAFDVGNQYGWVSGPEQSLPQGFVFPAAVATSGDNAGFFNNADIHVHFDSFGNAEAVTIKVQEVSTGKEAEVKVDANGKVTVKEFSK